MSAHQCKPIAGGEILNAGTHAGFDAFFDRSYASVVDLLTEVFDSTTVGLDQARSAFASTFRFWSKLGPHDDPLDWTLTDAFARQRRRWTADATDSRTPTVGHSAAVLRRHGFSDSQLRTITGLHETTNLASEEQSSNDRHRSGDAEPNLDNEKRIVVSLARRRKVFATVVLTGMAILIVAFEFFVARK